MPKQPCFPTSWYPLCRSADLKPGQVRQQTAFGQSLALFRTESGKVAVLAAHCVHMGADLTCGQVVGERLQCPLHHWQYGKCGRCEQIPGVAAIPARAQQAALHCEEHYGLVFAFLGGTPTFPFPHFPDETPDLYSRASSMTFATPYQVLAANSFDAQHFATVHNRELIEPPALSSQSPYHLAVTFRAWVRGDHFHDRFLRRVGVDTVELSAHCWGGNLILAYNARTNARILFTVLPIDETHSRIYLLNVLADSSGARLPSLLRRSMVEVMHRLTLAFLKADIAVMRQLQFQLGVLLPDQDRCFIEWVKYWKALPVAAILDADKR